MSVTDLYIVHAGSMSLIPIKHCIVLIADDNTLMAAPQSMPSEAHLTRMRNILHYGSFGGEHLHAYSGHKCIAWCNPGSAMPCMA